MNCSNVINLGCFGSCENIELPSEVMFESSDTELTISYMFNGSLIKYTQTHYGISTAILDAEKLNEDYDYIINVFSKEIGTNQTKENCFKFKIKPQS